MISLPSRFPGIEIPQDNPFQYDRIGYAQYASVFTGMIDMYKDTGSVIAINGRWGIGKSTFMKMWMTSLPQDRYSTVYFNAWETDYFSDPLVAILGELKEISQDSEGFNEIIATLGKITVTAGSAALKGVLKKATGIDSEVLKESIDEVKSALQNELNEYSKQKQTLTEFKRKLSHFVAGQEMKPVIFIIDELDRCNPHYAVRVLEIVKHFFEIPNICFVLAVDKKQLECSIKGFYGSSEIDAENYLRRFIDIEFRMPEPDINEFTAHLFENYRFQDFFDKLEHKWDGEEEEFKHLAMSLCEFYHLDLRTYDKVFAHTRLTYAQQGTEAILVEIILLLCFFRIADKELFDKISAHGFTVQELLTELENKCLKNISDKTESGRSKEDTVNHFAYVIIPLLILYNRIDGTALETVFNDGPEAAPLICSFFDMFQLKGIINQSMHAMNRRFGLRRVLNSVNLLKQFE